MDEPWEIVEGEEHGQEGDEVSLYDLEAGPIRWEAEDGAGPNTQTNPKLRLIVSEH